MKRSKVDGLFKNSSIFIKGKTNTNSSGYIVDLFDGFSLEFVIDEEFREPADSIYIYLYSSGFSKVMAKLFNGSDGVYDKSCIAHSFLPRKLRNDIHGCVAMGMPGIEDSDKSLRLYNGGANILFQDLSREIESLRSADDIFDFLYRSDTGRLMAVIEEAWALCFVCAARGLNRDETKKVLEVKHCQPFSAKSKAFDETAVDTFFKVYESVADHI